jgi:hypothetical protein
MSLSDKINALTQPMPGMVRLADVLPLVEHAFAVEIRDGGHARPEPQSEVDRIHYATLDTAWDVLRVGAARAVLAGITGQIEEATGEEFDQARLFRESAADGGPERIEELTLEHDDSPAAHMALHSLYALYNIIGRETTAMATEGWVQGQAEDGLEALADFLKEGEEA